MATFTVSYEYVFDGVPVNDRTTAQGVSYEYVFDGIAVADAEVAPPGGMLPYYPGMDGGFNARPDMAGGFNG